jgi:uncharacterized protein YmfQ (DUF2313 family)
MTLKPREMTAEDWQPLVEAGLNEQGLLKVAYFLQLLPTLGRRVRIDARSQAPRGRRDRHPAPAGPVRPLV